MVARTEIRNLEGRKMVSSIGMIVLLVSFSMLFATLLLGYAIYRLTSDVWPPMGMQRVPLFLPTVSTFIIAVSSLSLWKFEKEFELKKEQILLPLYLVTLTLGAAFMGVQFKLWASMKAMGLYVEAGIFPSLFYTLTWIHAAHIVAGLLGLLLMIPAIIKQDFDEKATLVANVSKFWHFLGIVWFLMYVVMFVL
ncbi:cytochrome c oxidase subunit 3 [Halobacteriovorax sp. GB3]|uniref:cytochrome c oxidase subunit 3 n=1 Tax=Halobacteriovorax sp. GB3 TaxID=2719615 RepID=UPI002362534D|nr:cytochrome c oxidase subunit 3 [Halobacteriovorax sp. GB3]MDD0854517.1 cytochrome c oxidase subunit 3 [Halobacteriovorax sp. GB3]